MDIDNLGGSVGKKIVEALKLQEDVSDNNSNFSEAVMDEPEEGLEQEGFDNDYNSEIEQSASDLNDVNINNVFQQSLNKMNLYNSVPDYEYPTNVAILNNLIAKLPVGVSKQTGALIIRQTMEALGIPMNSVIQEAKQVQENLTHKASECQQNIIDYKKQINILEVQSMQFQRQAIAMNDIIALFNN